MLTFKGQSMRICYPHNYYGRQASVCGFIFIWLRCRLIWERGAPVNHGDMEGTGPMEREASICHTPKPLPGIFLSFVPPVFSSH